MPQTAYPSGTPIMSQNPDLSQNPDSDVKLGFLSRPQRRVLGVLLEKAFTTPDVYPLTIKATAAGCNQKSNRDPVVEYDEERVERVLDELREIGLAAVVHTESGRSPRYRHYMRHVVSLSEPQLAILTELMLRGRQSLGDLRVRAGRMVPIDSLDDLRKELQNLIDRGFVQADAPLERRGAEVDHNLYPPNENHQPLVTRTDPDLKSVSSRERPEETGGDGNQAGGIAQLIERIQNLERENSNLGSRCSQLEERLSKLENELGG